MIFRSTLSEFTSCMFFAHEKNPIFSQITLDVYRDYPTFPIEVRKKYFGYSMMKIFATYLFSIIVGEKIDDEGVFLGMQEQEGGYLLIAHSGTWLPNNEKKFGNISMESFKY